MWPVGVATTLETWQLRKMTWEDHSLVTDSLDSGVTERDTGDSRLCCRSCHCFDSLHWFSLLSFLADHRQMDADLMDEKRKEHIAYEYLCHLEEAKK